VADAVRRAPITLGVRAPGRVLVGQTVDETHARAAPQHGRNVDGRRAEPGERRNLFQAAQQLLNLGRRRGLDRSDDDILAAHFAAAAFIEHAEGLPDAGSAAQKDFQLASLAVAFFRLDAAQKLLGRRPAMGRVGHG